MAATRAVPNRATEAPPAVDVLVESALWAREPASEATVCQALGAAAAALGARVPPNAEVSVVLADDAAVQMLNRQWRGRDAPTNVLSFPAPPSPQPTEGAVPLGDIALAFETLAREAHEENKPFAHHLAHLVVHGFLHLVGEDHENDAEAEQMERLERVILARLGIPDPYAAEGVRADAP